MNETDGYGRDTTASHRVPGRTWVTACRIENSGVKFATWVTFLYSKLQKSDDRCSFSARATWTHIMHIVERNRHDRITAADVTDSPEGGIRIVGAAIDSYGRPC